MSTVLDHPQPPPTELPNHFPAYHDTRYRTPRWSLAIALWLLIAEAAPTFLAAAAPQPPSKHDFSVFVAGRVKVQAPQFQKGDLVTRELTEKLLQDIEAMGWTVKGKEEVLKDVLPADDFLVQQLSDEKGRAFLKKINDLPEGIDRLDRLARMPQGKANVRSLIRKVPNGEEWIEAMTTTKRGRILGDRLSNSRHVKDFNAPTGHIYRLGKLIDVLHARLTPLKES